MIFPSLLFHRQVRGILLANLTIGIGMGIILPVLSLHASNLGLGPGGIGLMFAGFTVGHLISRVPGGILADLLGVRKVFAITLFLLSIPFILLSLIRDPMIFMLIWAVSGMLAGSSASAMNAFLTHKTDQKSRGEGMGLLITFYLIGLAGGSFLSNQIVQITRLTTVFFAAALTAMMAALIVVTTTTPSPLGTSDNNEISLWKFSEIFRKTKEELSFFRKKGKMITLLIISTVPFFSFSVWGAIQPFIPLFIRDVLGGSAETSSLVFAILFGTMAIAQPVFGKLSDRIDALKQVIVGTVLIITSIILLGIASGFMLLTTFLVFEGIGASAVIPSSLKLVGDWFEEDAGKAFGVRGTFADTGQILGPLIGGGIYFFSPRLTFPLLSILGIIPLILTYMLWKGKFRQL